jgi:hypothetical protein
MNRSEKHTSRPWGRLDVGGPRCPTLPRSFPRSTIGAGGLNFRVRNVAGCTPSAMTTELYEVWVGVSAATRGVGGLHSERGHHDK